MNHLKEAVNIVPTQVIETCDQLWQQGISCLAIGGAPRDLLLKRHPLKDWDFEIRPREGFSIDIEKVLTQTLGKQLQSLGFGVYRLTLEGHLDLEFSLPRKEEFTVELKNLNKHPLGHRDVEFTLDTSLSYAQAFARRDLTINAIGLEYEGGQWNWIDPLNGIKDLEDKVARPCSENFAMDPVRFLRALRFKHLFDLKFSSELEVALSQSNLSLATDHYLLYEATKAGFFPFMRELFELIEKLDVKIPAEWPELDFLKDSELEAMFYSQDQLLLFACWQGHWTLSDMGKLERFLKLRRGRAKHFLTGKVMADEMLNVDWPKTVEKWVSSKWSDVLEDDLFIRCFDFHKHWESWTRDEEAALISDFTQMCAGLNNWRKYFPRELEGQEKFNRDQEVDEVAPNKRALYKLWCHVLARSKQ